MLHVFQKLKHTESDKLQVQIQAYLDNVFDVGALLEDAETKNAALERVEELEENMSHVRDLNCWFYSVKIHKTDSLMSFIFSCKRLYVNFQDFNIGFTMMSCFPSTVSHHKKTLKAHYTWTHI